MLEGIRNLVTVLVFLVLTIYEAEMSVADCSKSLQSESPKMVQIYGQQSNLCLRASADGTLAADRCEEKTTGIWFMVKVRDGIHKFFNAETCQVLAKVDGNLGLIPSGTGSNTEWAVPKGPGFGKMHNMDGKQCLDVVARASDFKSKAILFGCHGNKNQMWMVVEMNGRKETIQKLFNDLGLTIGQGQKIDASQGLVLNLLNSLGLGHMAPGPVRELVVLELLKKLGL